jgi:hypothetical protein
VLGNADPGEFPVMVGFDDIIQGIPCVLAIVAAMAAMDRHEGAEHLNAYIYFGSSDIS